MSFQSPWKAWRAIGVRGTCRPAGAVARADVLAEAAHRLGITTVGIGDGGNEVGFGGVREHAFGQQDVDPRG